MRNALFAFLPCTRSTSFSGKAFCRSEGGAVHVDPVGGLADVDAPVEAFDVRGSVFGDRFLFDLREADVAELGVVSSWLISIATHFCWEKVLGHRLI